MYFCLSIRKLLRLHKIISITLISIPLSFRNGQETVCKHFIRFTIRNKIQSVNSNLLRASIIVDYIQEFRFNLIWLISVLPSCPLSSTIRTKSIRLLLCRLCCILCICLSIWVLISSWCRICSLWLLGIPSI